MNLRAFTVGLGLAAAAALAPATPSILHADVIAGRAGFDALVQEAGGTLSLQRLAWMQNYASHWTFDDFTITSTHGRIHMVDDDYSRLRATGSPGALSGAAIDISPNLPAPMWGLTFDFEQPVNAFGLEIGDWGTCCFPSALYIAFDGGATRLVATAQDRDDNPGIAAYRAFTDFIGAFDRSGTFSRVTFYGDGLGEYLVAGGTIRYSALPVEVAGDPAAGPDLGGGLPEPSSVLLSAAGLLVLLGARRRWVAAERMARAQRVMATLSAALRAELRVELGAAR